MKKISKKNLIIGLFLFGGLLLNTPSVFSQGLESLIVEAESKTESDYTVPSFTELRKNLVAVKANQSASSAANLQNALGNLKSKEMPYNIVMNIHGDPKTQMAFNWFTNENITGGKVQIVEGIAADDKDFATPLIVKNAVSNKRNDLNYNASNNNLKNLAGIATNTKKSYTENKALVTGLRAGTTYSFRVGKAGAWSETGIFTTAKAGKGSFSFIYTTDPQANSYEMFDVSQRTTHAANKKYPNADFWLHCGDLVDTPGSQNSEWEWERVFETQQDIFMNKPFAPVHGNHDKSANRNYTYHFNTEPVDFDRNKAVTPGSVYSFVYGDALFMALNYEDYSVAGYLEALSGWMEQEVSKYPDLKWRIVFFHKAMFTGGGHQKDGDAKLIRDKMLPVFDALKIDIAIQGHDHIYEVIGPLKMKKLIEGAVSGQTIVATHPRENVTGLSGGIFNTDEGTLYFLNNSAGKKKYDPRSQAQMNEAESSLGIDNYFSLFTGRFGQTGNPTFSNVTVSTDEITIATYEVLDNATVQLFDEFKVVKTNGSSTDIINVGEIGHISIYPNPANDYIFIKAGTGLRTNTIQITSINGAILYSQKTELQEYQINISNYPKGIYIVNVNGQCSKMIKN